MAESYPGGSSSMCVESATIAAFLDGTLDPHSRAGVIAHLASCQDCSELVAEVIRTDEEIGHVSQPAEPGPARVDYPAHRRTLWMRPPGLAGVGALVAIAASLLLVVFNGGSQLEPLVAIVGNERLILARPTGGFHYGPPRSPTRGSSDSGNLQLAAEVARLRQRAEQTNKAADLHAYGVGRLVAGDTVGAIDSLQAAAQLQPDDATFLADLGAAQMSLFVERNDQSDATRALESFDKSLTLTPALKEPWFNKALLLERMNRPADALAAWTKYLELSDDQAWRDEAVRNQEAVQRQLGKR